MKHCVSQGQGGDLIAAAAALSVLIAQGKTAEQIELLSALFDILADNLALLSLKVPSGETFCPCREKDGDHAENQNQGRCP